jgi:hypothetical protein
MNIKTLEGVPGFSKIFSMACKQRKKTKSKNQKQKSLVV